MPLYRYYPVPGERVGFFWCTCQIKGLAVLEFGPMGTTNFATRHMGDRAPLYSTHINDHILTFGETGNLEAALRDLDQSGQFEAIVMALSSSTSIIGFDMESFCLEQQPHTKAKLIPLSMSSLGRDYTHGMTQAMETFLQLFAQPCPVEAGTYNLLGCCDDEPLLSQDLAEIQAVLRQDFGCRCRMCYPYETSLDEIRGAAAAQFNVVLRREALPAAQWLQAQFGTPYVFSDCYGVEGMTQLQQGLSALLGRPAAGSVPAFSVPDSPRMRQHRVLILGSRASALPLARCLRQELHIPTVEALCFSREAGPDNPTPYDEAQLEQLVSTMQPDVVLGNSVLLDFPGLHPQVRFPILKPAGIVGKTPLPDVPLRTLSGLTSLADLLDF